MLRVPVTSNLLFISLLDPQVHAPVRDADLIELGPFGPEAKPLVESDRGRLGVKVDLRETLICGQFHEVAHDLAADPGAAVLWQYCDAPNLTGGLEPPRANCVTFWGEGEHVMGDGIRGVPFLVLRDALLDDEHGPPHGLDGRAVRGPAGGVQGHRSWGPHRLQTLRASRAARPM
jgi:hypothetical protein